MTITITPTTETPDLDDAAIIDISVYPEAPEWDAAIAATLREMAATVAAFPTDTPPF
jgi:hypothetical protein